MRINLDDRVLNDPRFDGLANALNITRGDAVYSCIRVWFFCYSERSPVMSVRSVDRFFREGFAKAMCDADLATQHDDDHIRIGGVSERIAFLAEQSKRGKKGAKSKTNGAKQTLSERSANAKRAPKSAQANAKRRLSLSLTLTPDHSQAPDLPPDQAQPPDPGSLPLGGELSPAVPAHEPGGSEFQAIVTEYFERFEREYGAKPSFDGQTGKLLARLITKHGADVVREKLRIAYESPPPWPTTPWSMSQIASPKHWDALVPNQRKPAAAAPRQSGTLEFIASVMRESEGA
jgi:hypothetical protein